MEKYPKVKVRGREEEEDADQFNLELTSLQSLKGFLSLSAYDSFPDDSPTSIVRIPGSVISSSARSQDPAIKETNTKKETESDGYKTNTRANLASRPRAVLSSPDNDSMIGSTNKTGKEALSTVRNHNLCQNRLTQCKLMPNKPKAAMKTGCRKNDLHAGGQLITNDPSKISSHLKGKPEPLPRKTHSKPTKDK